MIYKGMNAYAKILNRAIPGKNFPKTGLSQLSNYIIKRP